MSLPGLFTLTGSDGRRFLSVCGFRAVALLLAGVLGAEPFIVSSTWTWRKSKLQAASWTLTSNIISDMQTADTDQLFRTDAELDREAARSAKAARLHDAGDPIRLSSKPLDLAVSNSNANEVYVAESGFTARKIDVQVLL